ncbi:MAG TPA: tyrosine-type recombinase/integrase [Urbifossiella sp.]|nr:tyrosine-type recombinase/integrase [Urbifossiella sp.]
MLPGKFDSAQSKTAFARLQLELQTQPIRIAGEPLTVARLFVAFKGHAEKHYRRPDGSLTHEVSEYATLSRLVRPLYGKTLGAEFGPLDLKAVREAMIGNGWCRSLINQRIGRLKRVFKWGVAEQLVPAATYQALLAVDGLQAGRCKVRESEPVQPVPEHVIDSTLPFLNRHVRGMVEFQRYTGCRPGEACQLRRADIDTGGKVWLYRPRQHKTSWRGKPRVIAIGPKAQKVIREFFTPNLEDYLFSPRRNVAEFHAQRTANRKTPLFPSHERRNARSRQATPSATEAYTATSYGHAVAKACDRAWPPLGKIARQKGESVKAWWGRLSESQQDDVKAWQRQHRWHPNQLRHTFATKARKEHGLEAAQVLLGHARADVTQVYAERNLDLAVNVAAKIG